jgi:site-specific DNA-methyltransferase (adenine-specific)
MNIAALPTPYYQDDAVVIYHGDGREILPLLADDSADLVLTDPPYGVDKADWDDVFPVWWLDDAARIAPVMGVMPGVPNLLSIPRSIGRLIYRWTLAAHIVNGMTRGALGYGNWIPCLVYAAEGVSLYRQNSDAGRVVIGRDTKPDHPSPKPYEAMRWLVSSLPGNVILDPFMGSGTTLRAAKDLGRRAIGIELEERYCEIAAKRMAQTVLPLGELA